MKTKMKINVRDIIIFIFVLNIIVIIAQLFITGNFEIINIMPNIVLPMGLYCLENPNIFEPNNKKYKEGTITANHVVVGVGILTGAYAIGYSIVEMISYV